MEDDPVTLTASQAAELLGVRRETLYAYVSRGQIHSEPGPDGRTSRYRRADIERLLRQKAVRRRPETAAEGALHFGSPVLESGVSQLGDGRIHYRGLDARRLAGERRVEEVAAWLWLGDFEAAESLFVADPAVPDGVASILAVTGSPWRLESLQAILPILGLADPSAWAARDRTELARVGARIVASMIEVVTSSTTDSGGLAERLAAGWTGAGASALDSVDAVELLGACLILCADHELNVSTFTARCVASAGSPLHSVVAAGLAALQGPKHGGHTRRVEALFREAGSPDGVRAAFEDRLRRGEPVPGFGHRLHVGGDPRYLEIRERLAGAPEAMAWVDAVEHAGRELLGERPTVDVMLALVGRALGLPRDAPITLFALGRTVGWIAHAIEQVETGQLIRPRARYVGPDSETRA